MATQTITVETYQDDVLVETRQVEVDVPDAPQVQVTVDPQALSDAQAKIAAATTVPGLRTAVQAALNLLNPGT